MENNFESLLNSRLAAILEKYKNVDDSKSHGISVFQKRINRKRASTEVKSVNKCTRKYKEEFDRIYDILFRNIEFDDLYNFIVESSKIKSQ